MASRLPAQIGAALGRAAAYASVFRRIAHPGGETGRLWKGAILCGLIVILAMRLAMAGIAGFVREARTIGIIGIAATISLAIFEYQSLYAGRTAINDPRPRSTSAAAQEPEIVPAAGTTSRSAEDLASFDRWKSGVEQALKAAEVRGHARQQGGARPDNAGEAIEPKHMPEQQAATPIDVGLAREAAKVQANALNQMNEGDATSETKDAAATGTGAADEAKSTKQPGPFSQSRGVDDARPVPTYHRSVALGREAPPWRRRIAHVWGRGRWRGRRYGWTYYRLTGVARGFPYVLSVR